MSSIVRYVCLSGDGSQGEIQIDGRPLPLTRAVLIDSSVDKVNTVTVECLAREGLDITLRADVVVRFILIPGHVLVESDADHGERRRWTVEEVR